MARLTSFLHGSYYWNLFRHLLRFQIKSMARALDPRPHDNWNCHSKLHFGSHLAIYTSDLFSVISTGTMGNFFSNPSPFSRAIGGPYGLHSPSNTRRFIGSFSNG